MAASDTFSFLKNFTGSLSLAKKISFVLLAGGTLAALLYLILWTGQPNLKPIYSNLTPEDAGAVIERLKADKIPYRVAGNTILAPEDQIFEITMTLAARGLPQGGGVGFEIFDRTKLGMTEFEQNVNYQRALQGEIARTISRLSEVKSCRVHIVMPAESLFVEEEKPSSASIALELKPGKRLTQGQIYGIIHLVSTSVPNLSRENISILDHAGNLLAGQGSLSPSDQTGSEHLLLQQKIEENLESRVKTMLESVLGSDKSIVRVSCELDFKKQEMTEEKYDPNKIPRSEQVNQTITNNPAALQAGVPGVLSNLSDAPATSGKDLRSVFEKREQTTNYEISKLTRRVVDPVGVLKKVSVAVVVDGVYREIPGPKGGAPVVEYVPRSPDELETLKKIVQRAVNYDSERGDQIEVANMPFAAAKAEASQAESGWRSAVKMLTPLVKYIFAGILLLLIFMGIVRPMVKWLTHTPAIDGRILKQLPMTVGEMEKEYGEMSSSGDPLSLAAIRYKDQTVKLIRGWLQEK